ncbi:MAG: hypothetical protein J5623_06260 [Clostridiales bacterium]|nr:hypothetical protein [Clostridiales bacterium]
MDEKNERQQPIEGNVFYRNRWGDFVRKYAVELLLVFIILAISITIAIISSQARSVFREARGIRTALRFVGTEYYGGNSSIYDPSTPTGLTKGAAERVASISSFNGSVYLYQWDEKHNIPLRFEYRKGLFTVQYVDKGVDETDTEATYGTVGDWSVSYSFKILEFKSE